MITNSLNKDSKESKDKDKDRDKDRERGKDKEKSKSQKTDEENRKFDKNESKDSKKSKKESKDKDKHQHPHQHQHLQQQHQQQHSPPQQQKTTESTSSGALGQAAAKFSYFASYLSKNVKNVMESDAMRSIVTSVQNKVQELDTAIGETVLPALISSKNPSSANQHAIFATLPKTEKALATKDKSKTISASAKEAKAQTKATSGAMSFTNQSDLPLVLKPNKIRFETRPETCTNIPWKIRSEISSKMEAARHAQAARCVETVYQDISWFNVQVSKVVSAHVHPNLSDPAHVLSRSILDHLTDYELKEILRRLSLLDKLRLRRVSQRWRRLMAQVIHIEYSLALVHPYHLLLWKSVSGLALDFYTPLFSSSGPTMGGGSPIGSLASTSPRRGLNSNATVSHLLFSILTQPMIIKPGSLAFDMAKTVTKNLNRLQMIALATPIDHDVFKLLIEQRNLASLWLCGLHFQNNFLLALPDYACNLNYLWLHQCAVNDEGLRVVARECFKLTHLRISECNQLLGNFTSVLSRLLQKFEIYQCPNLASDTWVNFFITDRRSLLAISVEYCLLDDALMQGLSHCEKLQNVRLRLMNTTENPTDLKLNLLRNLPRLEMLALRDYCKPCVLTDPVFTDIQRGCDRLIRLEIELPDSKEIEKSVLTDLSFERLVDNCAKLQCLSLTNFFHLTDRTLHSLISLKLLKQLILRNVSFTDQQLEECLGSMRALNRLTFVQCASLTERFVRFLFKEVEKRNIWFFLTLDNNPTIRKESVQQMAAPRTLHLKLVENQ